MKKSSLLIALASLILCLCLTANAAWAESRTIRYGSTGEDVAAVQARLIELGYLSAGERTRYDRDTEAAAKLFQSALGVRQNGALTVEQQSVLLSGSAPTLTECYAICELSSGSKGEAVKVLQTRLIELGYLTEKASGTYDAATRKAVTDFQNASGIKATGKADMETRKRMNAANAAEALPYYQTCELYYRLQGPAVKVLQERLRTLGFYVGEIDGVFDTNTRQAVTDFQTASGIRATGRADTATRQRMNAQDAITAEAYYQVCPLRYGQRTPAVVVLQLRLVQLGYMEGDPSTYYSRAVQTAVKEFQTASGLKATGTADAETRQKMNASDAVTAAEYYKVCTLSYGSKHEAVKVLQARLIELGYLTGTPSGRYDKATSTAVKEFQAAMGIRAYGTADMATRRQMISASAMTAADYHKICELRMGNSGESVKLLQQALTTLGYYNGKISGTFDKDTKTAVTEFQAANGLRATGTADTATRKAMIASTAKKSDEYYRTLPLRYNVNSAAVRVLQAQLQALGYFTGELSNSYGPSTRQAVAEFQTANSIRATGTADAATRAALVSGNAVSLSEYNKIRPLSYGNSGESVSQVQQQLTALGYYTGRISGKFDSATKTAVITFQQANGLNANGKADAATRKLLNEGKGVNYATYETYCPLKSGNSGSAVKVLQSRLNALGYYYGALDGKYGSAVRDAVKVFQSANGIRATGTADMATRKAMLSTAAVTREAYDASRTVKRGDTGYTVRALQVRLDELGYYKNTDVVLYDAKLVDAVKLFQTAHSIKSTGIADVETRKKIFSGEAMTYENYCSYRALKYGERSDAVGTVQRQLFNLGYWNRSIDNYFGVNMRNAIKVFQAANGFAVNGNVTVEMRRALNAGSCITLTEYYRSCALVKGNKGDAVVMLQQRLTALGYYEGKADGYYGSAVADAVKLFQKVHAIKETGSADRDTRALMNGSSAISYDDYLKGNASAALSLPANTRTQKIEKLIAVARSKMGCKYVHLSHGPNTFDCSNFTAYCFAQIGVKITAVAKKQGYLTGYTKITDTSKLERGDLLVFDTVKDDDDLSDHVGIYLGDGTFIHCSSVKGMVVISNLKTYGNFSWGLRLL